MTEETPKNRLSLPPLSIPMSIVIAGTIIGLSIIIASNPPWDRASPEIYQPPALNVNVQDIDTTDAPYVGENSASVTLVAWEDSQCPFCKKFETEVLPSLIKEYVDTGKVKIVFKHYEFLGPNSQLAGAWGLAVWELYPSSYFKWRTTWFERQPQENTLSLDRFEAHLVKMTNDVGLDAENVRALVDSKKELYDAVLSDDQAEGAKYGITGTPGFITGKVRISGAQPLVNFVAALDAQL